MKQGINWTWRERVKVTVKRLFPPYFSLIIRLINYIYTKAKCCHLKNWPVKGLCDRCLSEFIDWRYRQSCWYCQPSFVNYCPSNLLFDSTLPHVNPLSVWISILYTRIKCVRGGILGFRQINSWRKVPLQVNFFDDDVFHCLLWVYLSTVWTVWIFEGFYFVSFFDFAESSKAFLAESSNRGVYLYIDSYSGPNFTPLTECCRSGSGQIRIPDPT